MAIIHFVTITIFVVILNPVTLTAADIDPMYKEHLQRYGYVEYAHLKVENGSEDGAVMEYAVRTFQEKFGFKPTGILDAETMALMRLPRFDYHPDIINGINYRGLGRKGMRTDSYELFPGRPRW